MNLYKPCNSFHRIERKERTYMRGEVLQIEFGLGVVRFREYDNNQNGCLVGFYVKFVDNPYAR